MKLTLILGLLKNMYPKENGINIIYNFLTGSNKASAILKVWLEIAKDAFKVIYAIFYQV